MDTSVWISLCGLLLTAAAFFAGKLTAAKNTGKQDGVLLTELGYIKKGIDDMNRKMEQLDRRYLDLEKRVTAAEEIIRLHHNAGGV